jgi:hypothetical protein
VRVRLKKKLGEGEGGPPKFIYLFIVLFFFM